MGGSYTSRGKWRCRYCIGCTGVGFCLSDAHVMNGIWTVNAMASSMWLERFMSSIEMLVAPMLGQCVVRPTLTVPWIPRHCPLSVQSSVTLLVNRA